MKPQLTYEEVVWYSIIMTLHANHDKARRMVQRAKADPDVDSSRLAIRLVAAALGISYRVASHYGLRLMMRPETETNPILIGLRRHEIADDGHGVASKLVRVHVCRSTDVCVGDDSCEGSDPPILYEIVEATSKDGTKENHVIGVWSPSTGVSFLPLDPSDRSDYRDRAQLFLSTKT